MHEISHSVGETATAVTESALEVPQTPEEQIAWFKKILDEQPLQGKGSGKLDVKLSDLELRAYRAITKVNSEASRKLAMMLGKRYGFQSRAILQVTEDGLLKEKTFR